MIKENHLKDKSSFSNIGNKSIISRNKRTKTLLKIKMKEKEDFCFSLNEIFCL
jgi:hypothetical protein